MLVTALVLFVIFGSQDTHYDIQHVPVSYQTPRHKQYRDETPDERERSMDREMLKSFYPEPLSETVPVDYPRKQIGACPDSKRQVTSLPHANMPMSMLMD